MSLNPEGEQVSKLSKSEELVQERNSKHVIRVIMYCLADINSQFSCSVYKILFIEIPEILAQHGNSKGKQKKEKEEERKKYRHKLSNLNVKLKNQLHFLMQIQRFRHSPFFIFQLSHPHLTTGKAVALTRRTFVGKVKSLLFNMLSRFVIAFFQGANVF